MSLKSAIRLTQSEYLQNIPQDVRHAAEKRIYLSLIHNNQVLKAQTICSFISYRNEVDTHRFIKWCLNAHKTVAAPRIDNHILTLRKFTSLSECIPSRINIPEPPVNHPLLMPQDIDVFIVPGLAFDHDGYRIGYGKGYYDRLLPQTAGYTIGICFTHQLVISLPHDDHDIPVDQIVTDTIHILKK